MDPRKTPYRGSPREHFPAAPESIMDPPQTPDRGTPSRHIASAAGLISPAASTPSSIGKRSRSPDPFSGESSKHQKIAPSPSGSVHVHDSLARMSLSTEALSAGAFNVRLRKAEHSTAAIVHKLNDARKLLASVGIQNSAGLGSEELDESLNIFSRTSINYKTLMPVALIGSSGTGKSSSMNSLLAELDTAAVSHGDRGTFVVHEYRAALPSQVRRYVVIATYMTDAEIRARVKAHCDHLLSTYPMIRNPTDTHNSNDEDAEDNEDERDLSDSRKTSLEFFTTLLCDHDDFKSMDVTEGYFARNLASGIDVVEHLTTLIISLKRKHTLENSTQETVYADTDEELSAVLHRVSRPKAARTQEPMPHAWPLLSNICVHLKNDLLEFGAVLGDPPGLGDNNNDIVEATHQYLNNAGLTLVFAHYKRVTNNKDVDMHLRRCIRAGKLRQTALVVTMIDDIRLIPKVDWDVLSDPDQQRVRAAEATLRQLKDKKRDLTKAEIKVEEESDDIAALRQCKKDLKRVEAEIASVRMQELQLHISIQTAQTREKLRGRLRELARQKTAPDLSVYFVSNTEYRKHLDSDDDNPPLLDAEATGVSRLQAMIHQYVADRKLEELYEAVRYGIPSALSAISAEFDQSPLAQKQRIKGLIAVHYTKVRGVTDTLQIRSKTAFVENIEPEFSKQRSKWDDATCAKMRSWEGELNAGTFAALIRRKGYWERPEKSKTISWNECIQEIMSNDLASDMELLDFDLVQLSPEVIDPEMTKLFGNLEQEFTAVGVLDDSKIGKTFYKDIQQERDNLLKRVTKCCNRFKTDVETIRHKLFVYAHVEYKKTGGGPTDYVSITLRPIYDACAKIQGTLGGQKMPRRRGANKQRIQHFCESVTGTPEKPSLFTAVYGLMVADYDTAVGRLVKGMGALLKRSETTVQGRFDKRFVDDGQEKKIMQEKTLEALEKAQKLHMEMELETEHALKAVELLQSEHESVWKTEVDEERRRSE